MFKKVYALLIITGLFSCLNANGEEGIADGHFTCVAPDPYKPNIVYAGAKNGLYKSPDGGTVWRQVFISSGPYKGINRVYITDSGVVFAAAKNGLFASYDAGESWLQLFRGKGKENGVLCMVQSPADSKIIFIGTEKGLFASKNSGKGWKKLANSFQNTAVRSIVVKPENPSVLYVCSDTAIYKTVDCGRNWEKIIACPALEDGFDEEEPSEQEEQSVQEQCGISFNCMAMRERIIFVGTNRGIYRLDTETRNWDKFNDEGMVDTFVNFILLSDAGEGILVATDEGAFRYFPEKESWQKIYSETEPSKTNHISFDSTEENFIWLAAEDGVCKAFPRNPESGLHDPGGDDVYPQFEDEPAILDVQDAAIRYAEVHPDKIRRWRRGAKFKAILPKVTFGIDHSKSDTYEIYTSSSTAYSIIGPADNTEGWDISFTWDLGDLVWNESQTSIDVRSKLMVQLRDDILNEITRYYYERRRLQVELAMNPPLDKIKRVEKRLRLEELTAYVDALTGGYLSREIKKNKKP